VYENEGLITELKELREKVASQEDLQTKIDSLEAAVEVLRESESSL